MRLIDSETTEKEMLFWADVYGYGGLTKDNIREILRDDKKTPTVDAVEVVRCKDCKHNPKEEWFGCPMVSSHKRGDDDYCSYGERRQT